MANESDRPFPPPVSVPVVNCRDIQWWQGGGCSLCGTPAFPSVPAPPDADAGGVEMPVRFKPGAPSRCVRHDEIACPSCLAYERNDWKARALRAEASLAQRDETIQRYRADLSAAAGECLVPLPEPHSDLARVLSANVLLRAERDLKQTQIGEHKDFIQRLLEAAGLCDPETLDEAVEAVSTLLNQAGVSEEQRVRAEKAEAAIAAAQAEVNDLQARVIRSAQARDEALKAAEVAEWVIENTQPGTADWSALWWRPERCGYTTILTDAGHYTEAEAKMQERQRPDVDIAHRLADVMPLARLRVDRDVLHNARAKALLPGTGAGGAK